MPNDIHSTAVIGEKVKLGDNIKIHAYVVVDGDTEIGDGTEIYPFAVVGVKPQDKKYRGAETKTIIGKNNRIREHVTIHAGTEDGGNITKIGDNNLIMVGVHIAHDCILGNNIVLANNATLAGHVEVDDGAVIGGLSAVHQFVRIGKGAMIGGLSGIERDIIPFGLAMGERANLSGLNLVGLKRSKMDKDDINHIRKLYSELFEMKDGRLFEQRLTEAKDEYNSDLAKEIFEFIDTSTNRGILKK